MTQYVDNILVASNDKKLAEETKVWLLTQFNMNGRDGLGVGR